MADTITREAPAAYIEDTGIQTGIIVTTWSKEERIARYGAHG